MTEDTSEQPVAIEVSGPASGFVQTIPVRTHEWLADEPDSVGGTDTGPTPTELLCSALGACTSMTVSMYARRKGWPLEHVHVLLRYQRVRREQSPGVARMVDHIERVVRLEGALSDEQRARLLDVANKCPVHQALSKGTLIDTALAPA